MARLVMVVALLLALLALTLDAAAADQRKKTSPLHLRGSMQNLCRQFLNVSDYVVSHCGPSTVESLDANCIESFELFAETPSLLIECEKHEQNRDAQSRMVQFLELYNKWQQHRTCGHFYVKEERAARRCGGAAVQTPWHEAVYPLYCDEIFELYKQNRHELDALCPRTPFSDAFWEAYADYVASPLCKTYYTHVRGATSNGCASKTTSGGDACAAMFRWYTQHRDRVERECLEVQAAKPFYKGFYAWKRAHQT